MKFLVVLITIFLYRNWIGDNPLRSVVSFDGYAGWFRDNIAAPNVRFVICIAIPVLLIGLLSNELWYWVLGVPWLLLAVVVMAYCIDVVDIDELFDDHAQWLMGLDESSNLDEVKQRQEDFKLLAVYDVFQSLYPALFWFLILGPAGALLYLLSRLYLDRLDDEDSELNLVDQVVFWLEWPAAKVSGFVFALVGHFGKCFDAWLGSLFDTREAIGTNLVVAACAASSVHEDGENIAEYVRTSQESNRELKELLARTSYGWLGLAALVTILGF